MNFGARKVFAADAFPPQWVVDEDAKHVQMFRTCSGSASQRAPTTATHKTPASANSLFFMAKDAVTVPAPPAAPATIPSSSFTQPVDSGGDDGRGLTVEVNIECVRDVER